MTLAQATSSAVGPLLTRFRDIRRATERLCEPLEPDDYLLQSMPDASPVKWHLAHTAWFFETFLLIPHLPDYVPFAPEYRFLFNSYYETVGPRWPRPQRDLLARPTVPQVYRYRAYVDEMMGRLLEALDGRSDLLPVVELGLQHEQQHQELIVTDLKHAWNASPLRPVYCPRAPVAEVAVPSGWATFPESLAWIGHDDRGFCFDNETPRHRAFLAGFQLARRLVTNGDFLRFLEDDGYRRPELWLSEGWAVCQQQGWMAPIYWEQHEEVWTEATLSGSQPLHLAAPVCHLSYFEADAFARWAGARLPTEAEWEVAAVGQPVAGHFQESGRFHPQAVPARDDRGPVSQLHGDVWQWTASPYVGYPGCRPAEGALGEYNGKFMCNQFVLRGSSCATPRSHARHTYRNFFPPAARWQFTGVRLARDL